MAKATTKTKKESATKEAVVDKTEPKVVKKIATKPKVVKKSSAMTMEELLSSAGYTLTVPKKVKRLRD